MRTKADFKAARESCGLTQQNVADACGVSVRAVKRWEKPGWAEPPEDAWEYIDGMADLMVHEALLLVDRSLAAAEATGMGVVLTYHRDQATCDGPLGFENAVKRMAARHLEVEGIDVSFRYPDDLASSGADV